MWDQGSRAKQRRVDIGFFVDLATLRGPLCFLCGRSVQVNGGFITGADVAASPYCVRLLCGFSSFLGSLHWPADTGDLVNHKLSYLEVLILFEQWTGYRLLSEKVTRPHVRAHCPISISSVPVLEDLKFGRGVASPAVWSELLASFL